MGRVQDKVAIVTGAGSGIGRAIALTLASEGALVVASDLSGKQEETASLNPARVSAAHCDVTDPASVEALVEEAVRRHGKLDVMCNNAGYSAPGGKVHEIELSEFEKTYAINVRGMFLGIKYAAPKMMERGGSIINTASVGGIKAIPDYSPYLSSKAAAMQLTRAAAVDYGPNKIRVNALCPTTIRTSFMGGAPASVFDEYAKIIPLGRVGEVDDVAKVALFLASDESSFLTGGMYYVDGGSHVT